MIDKRLLILALMFIGSIVYCQEIPKIIETTLSKVPVNSSWVKMEKYVDTAKSFKHVFNGKDSADVLLKPFYYKFRPDTAIFKMDNKNYAIEVKIHYLYTSEERARKEFELIKSNLDLKIKPGTPMKPEDSDTKADEKDYMYLLGAYEGCPFIQIEFWNDAWDKKDKSSILCSEIFLNFVNYDYCR
jgi:hypothetical protein